MASPGRLRNCSCDASGVGVIGAGVCALAMLVLSCSTERIGPVRDLIPPAAITNLRCLDVNGADVNLWWTATGDDETEGIAAVYEIRYSLNPITETNWATARKAVADVLPSAPGSSQTAVVAAPDSSRVYYVALKAADDAGNWSGLSNVVIGDKTPPAITIAAVESDWISGVVTVSASASDNHMVKQVILLIDHVQRDTDTTAPWDFYWDVREVGNQTKHLLQVKAVDAAGNESLSAPAELIVQSDYVDVTEPNVEIDLEQQWDGNMSVSFRISFMDESSGIDWNSVAIDIYDITGQEPPIYKRTRLIHTWVFDEYSIESGDLESRHGESILHLPLVDHLARGRRLAVVVYDLTRTQRYDETCACEYYEYDWVDHGVRDLAGNHTLVVEEHFTVW